MSWRLSMICIDPLTIEEGPFFWLIPCSSLFKDVRSNLGTRSSCKKQSPTDLHVWNSERIIPTRCKRCAHFAPCILLLHDPTKGSSTKQSEKETHSLRIGLASCGSKWVTRVSQLNMLTSSYISFLFSIIFDQEQTAGLYVFPAFWISQSVNLWGQHPISTIGHTTL